MNIRKSIPGAFFLFAFIIISLTASAPVSAEDEVLFFVNNPENLTYVSMNKISSYLETYYRDLGIMNSQDIGRFYEILKTHGAPNSQTQDTQVALVIQDDSHKSNASGMPRGVLVVKGVFDKEKVLELLKKNYQEHVVKTGHTPLFSNKLMSDGKISIHKFGLPGLRERELVVLTMGDYTLFSSSGKLDYKLLNDTVKAIGQKRTAPVEYGESLVKYKLVLSGKDKELLESQIDSKYEKYKADHLKTSKRKGLKNFFVRKIADHKVNFIKKCILDLNDLNIEIYRMRRDSTDMKRLQVVSDFESSSYARKAKRKILSHLNDVIKGADNPNDKLGLSSNVRITSHENQCIIDCELGTAEEQMHCFALISSYIARSMLRK
jgi:hypothetical protein